MKKLPITSLLRLILTAVDQIRDWFYEPVQLDQLLDGGYMADITKAVGQIVHSVPVEKNAEGVAIPGLPVAANVKYSIDNTAVGSLVENTDGTADVKGLEAGTVNLSWVDTSNTALASSTKALTFTADVTPTSLDQVLS